MELLVVMAIIALVVTMSLPAFSAYGKRLQVRTTTRQLVGLISFARSLAISSRDEHAVVIDAEHHQVRVMNQRSGEVLEQVVRVPVSISVQVEIGGQPSQDLQFVFRPSGALAGRTVSVIVADDTSRQTIAVTGPTGAVSVAASSE